MAQYLKHLIMLAGQLLSGLLVLELSLAFLPGKSLIMFPNIMKSRGKPIASMECLEVFFL
jgi:hypothetical protein